MIRKLLILLVGLFFAFATSAKEEADSAHLKLYHRYYQLFSTDRAEEFYKASAQLQQNYMKQGETLRYYKIRQNEIFYDADHGQSYKAIMKANDMLNEMKRSQIKHYELAFMSLGSIFERRGSYRMAVHYYREALANIDKSDSTGLAHIYSQLAAINASRKTDEAWRWNERLAGIISHDSLYYKSYLTLKGVIYFFGGKKAEFFENKQTFDEYVKQKSALDQSGEHVMKVMAAAFAGKYAEALHLLDEKTPDMENDVLMRSDLRIRIYEMMGRLDLALKETDRRRDLRDSLNNDLLFNNLNEINATIGVAKANEQTAKANERTAKLNEQMAKEREKVAIERELWLVAVIVLLFLALGLIVSRYLSHRSYQKKIIKQNEQLEIALDEAKESDRMKGIFIRHISHEIRTPLNIITGYVQVIANSEFELERNERKMLLQAIDQNTVAITDIVNDLLEVSMEESKERYRREDKVAINELCRRAMEDVERKNRGRLMLNFQTELSDDFTILSNQGGIERILRQLLGNAVKFTEQGSVELAVHHLAADGTLRFTVTDTGIGISEEQSEQVFEHFYKVDSFKQGLGIGLSISRKIAVLLGGPLAIDKAYHDGTRMVLTIPVE